MTTVLNPRYREKGYLTPLTTTWNWWTASQNPLPTPSSTTAAGRGGWKATMLDHVTPRFGALQAEGGIVNSPMHQSEITLQCSDMGWKFEHLPNGQEGTWYGECTGNWTSVAYGPPPRPSDDLALISHLETLAATSAEADVQAPAVDSMVTLAELHQTLNMLGDPIRSLSDFLWSKALADADYNRARGRAAKSRALAQLIASLWLQYRYAFTPTLMEIENVIQELQTQGFSPRQTARSKQERWVESSRTWVGKRGGVNIDFVERTTSHYVTRATILYETRISPLQRFGITWQSMPAAVYELIPYSFVLDWFINVGDYIRAITPKLGVRRLVECMTTEVTHTVERKATAAYMSDSAWKTTRQPNGLDKAIYRNKSRNPNLPSPGLTIEYDPLYSLRGNRGVDAYLLFLQQFIRR